MKIPDKYMTNESDGKPHIPIRGQDRSKVTATLTSFHRRLTWHLSDGAKNSTSAELQHTVSNYISSLSFHSDDCTFLTSGSGPACETVTEEVALFVLAAHRTSGITGRRRALVWNIFACEKTKTDRHGEKKSCYCFKTESVQTRRVQWV